MIAQGIWDRIVSWSQELTEVTYEPDLQDGEMREALRAVLELATEDEERWDPPGASARLREQWRGGYEQAMTDIVEAIAQEWNVPAPTTNIAQEGAL